MSRRVPLPRIKRFGSDTAKEFDEFRGVLVDKMRRDDFEEFGPFTRTALKRTNYPAQPWDIVECDPSSGTLAIKLPNPSLADVKDTWIGVKNATNSTAAITVSAINAKIDGAATFAVVGSRAFQWFFSAGTEWQLGPGSAGTNERIPSQMVFSEVFRQLWFGNVGELADDRLIPPSLKWVDDPFTDTTTGRFTRFTESNTGTLTIAGGQASIAQASGAAHQDMVAEGVSIGMPQISLRVDAISRTGTNGAFASWLLGVVKDGNNHIAAVWNNVGNTVQLLVKKAGVQFFSAGVSTATWTFPVTLGISIVGNWATIYAYRGTAWEKVLGADINALGGLDFKSENYANWFGFFGCATPNTVTNTYVFDNFRVGRFGGVGIRDFFLVSNEDGTPRYLSATQVQVLATLAGASGQISEASQGVFTVDLEKKTFTQTAVIMVSRGGKTQNDHAGQLILYPNGDQRLTLSTFGDWSSPVFIESKLELAATQNLLVGSHIVSGMTTLSTTEPSPGGSVFGPWLMRQGGRWYMAYTASTPVTFVHYAVLEYSDDFVTWHEIGKDLTNPPRSGAKILLFNGVYYVLSSGDTTVKQYDLSLTETGIANVVGPADGPFPPDTMMFPYQSLEILLSADFTKWPATGGVDFSWGQIRWFASPRY